MRSANLRRWRSRAMAAATALSSLAFLVIAFACVRSYWVADSMVWNRDAAAGVIVSRGVIEIWRTPAFGSLWPVRPVHWWQDEPPRLLPYPNSGGWYRAEFGFQSGSPHHKSDWFMFAPCWVPLALTAILPASWAVHRRRQRA